LDFRPWIGQKPGTAIQGTMCDEHAFSCLAKGPFDLCDLLTKKGHGGAYCVLEFDVSFRPWPNDSTGAWFGLLCDILPHSNIIINFPFPVTYEVAKAIFAAYVRQSMNQPIRTSYPDLWMKPIISQDDLNSRLGYSLKTWPIQKWHRRARLNKCDPERLDAIFDNVVFGNLAYLACLLKSPRKFGNMSCNSGARYIGKKPPLRLSTRKIRAWLEDEKFAHQHPDWEEAVYRWFEKREKRKGKRKSDQEDSR
jgi:hypothetical protein